MVGRMGPGAWGVSGGSASWHLLLDPRKSSGSAGESWIDETGNVDTDHEQVRYACG